MGAIQRSENATFFVDGPGGTGKTYLYCALLASLRRLGHIVLAIASSESNYNIAWGKIMIFGGDFRQVLPVIRKEFLLRVGDGNEDVIMDNMVKLLECMVIPWESEHSINLLIAKIFPDLEDHINDATYMVERAVVTPTNEDVDMLNEKIINMFPDLEETMYSFDSVEDNPRNLYQPEFLNSISLGGLPPHNLTLKRGAPIMLLRNIDPKLGLCNGTRLLCRGSYQNLIDAEILIGQFAGSRVFLPRIPLKSTDIAGLPFELTRKQFPMILSFSITINKSQGQTIPHVGIYLPDHVFSHGQLYVALSIGVSKSTTTILAMKMWSLNHEQMGGNCNIDVNM
ncbi:uncharacterized protein [Malus domestica]|uniref:uncharacterized protein n=1 Tax=Malus domestica TaxID=3750 RepID=UPI003974C13B